MTLCGPVKDLYKFDDKAQVLCNGGKSCTVTCPSGMQPNHKTLQCLNPKRKKMNPLTVSHLFIKPKAKRIFHRQSIQSSWSLKGEFRLLIINENPHLNPDQKGMYLNLRALLVKF